MVPGPNRLFLGQIGEPVGEMGGKWKGSHTGLRIFNANVDFCGKCQYPDF